MSKPLPAGRQVPENAKSSPSCAPKTSQNRENMIISSFFYDYVDKTVKNTIISIW